MTTLKKSYAPGEMPTVLQHNPTGLDGRDCIELRFDFITLRLNLQDAEQLGEGLIKIVRMVERSKG